MQKGVVIKSTGRWYFVRKEDGTVIECGIKGNFRTKGLRTTNPVAVGDFVRFDIIDEEKGLINYIAPKKNYIIRKSTNLSKAYHIIASNVDQAIVLVGIAFPETPLEFLDRFLVSAEAYRIPVTIIFNKIDLFNDELKLRLKKIRQVYEDIGYKTIKCSATEEINTDIIADILKNKRTVVVGQSGVGKSALLNTIDNNLSLKTSNISDYHQQGKHTTTYAEMFELSEGGEVIDTPGIRGFGVVDIDKEEVSHFFPEIFKEAKNCKYNNCTHFKEPECSVKNAVEEDKIFLQRYLSYLSILNDDDERYRL